MTLTDTLARPGAVIHFADSGGTGDAVVFTHGAGVDSDMFAAQITAASNAGFRTVAWDMRGHGASPLDHGTRFRGEDALDDLAALCEHLSLKRPALVGHSLGGNLVQEFARRSPDRTARLIVIDSTWNAGPLTHLERFGLRIAAPSLATIPASRLPGLMAAASATTPQTIEYARGCFARMPKKTFLDVWRATLALVDPNPTYRCPVALSLIRGAYDHTGNISAAMPKWAAAEGITENIVPEAGHIAPLDAPGAVSAIILAALRRSS